MAHLDDTIFVGRVRVPQTTNALDDALENEEYHLRLNFCNI